MNNINHKLWRLTLLFFVMLALAVSSRAFPGELDTTFNTNGFALFDFPNSNLNYGNAVITNPVNNRVIVAGTAKCASGGNFCFAVTVYNASGGLDTTFNTTGRIRTLINGNDFATAVALDAGGKIIVAGYTQASASPVTYNFAVVRYNTDGTLDTGFGVGGIQTENFGGSLSSYARAVAVQSDGKIVVAGALEQSSGNQVGFAVVRYNTDGTRDYGSDITPTTSFNSDGRAVTLFDGSFSPGAPIAVAIDNNKILVAGNTANGYAVVRHNTGGSLDSSFGTSGKAVYSLGNPQLIVRSIAVQSDGKVVGAGGYAGLFAVFRLTDAGALDKSFGNAGYTFTAIPGNYESSANAIALIQGVTTPATVTDNIVVVGASKDLINNTTYFTVACFDLNGKLNPKFDDPTLTAGGDGIVTSSFNGSSVNTANSAAIHQNGKIVVAGYSGNGSTNFSFAVARYRVLGL